MFDDFEPNTAGFWQEPDFFLADLVSGFVNKGGMELGITLFVRGLVVTGTLVSEREYLEAMSDMFAGQAKKSLVKPTKEELKTAEEVFDFTHLAEDSTPDELREHIMRQNQPINPYADDDFDEYDDDLDESEPPIIRHLHLKDPVILQPQPAVSFSHSQVPIMRLRLTQIDGWMIGKVTTEDDDPMNDYPPPPPLNPIRH